MDFEKYKEFLDELFSRIAKLGLDVSDLEMDHIAIKTATLDEFNELKPEIAKFAKLKQENMVRGKPVDIYELNTPWIYKNYSISAIEIIGPNIGEVVITGFEHVEFVLKNGFQDFLNKYPDLDWDTSIMNAPDFAMIKLKLGEDMQVKFHLEPILEMISHEK